MNSQINDKSVKQLIPILLFMLLSDIKTKATPVLINKTIKKLLRFNKSVIFFILSREFLFRSSIPQ